MSLLRISMLVAVGGLVALVGCGDDDRGMGTDGGLMIMDSGPRVDSGPVVDSGMMGIDGGTPTGTCGGSACNLLTGGGCGMGEGCQFLAAEMGGTPEAMCTMAGTAGDLEACMTYTDCREGFACVTPGAGMTGTCQHYCCPGAAGADSACPTGQMCVTTFAGTDTGFCSFPDDCDAITGMGCTAPEGCYLGPGGTTQCAQPQPMAMGEGGACAMFVNECTPGHVCIESTCRKLCDRTTMMGCGAGQMCSIGLMGFETIGACDPLP